MNETRREILAAMADEPVGGPELADRLGVSRTAVWKHVEALREAGFVVESGDEGYSLAAVPEFGAEAVEFGLDAPFSVEYHGSIESTNDRARELAADGASDVVVLADEQTGGRGRLKRPWSGPSGGVWMSILLRPSFPPAAAPVLTLAAAVATTAAAREAGVNAAIKWPNDVVVPDGRSVRRDGSDGEDDRGGAKLAGILTEMEGEADRVSWVVIGIGVNADIDGAALPAGATSLRREVGDVNRRRFVQRLLEEFDNLRGDGDAVLDGWRTYADTLGRRVRVQTRTGDVVGEAVDVEFPGALVVDTGDERVRVHSGDCEHLRPV